MRLHKLFYFILACCWGKSLSIPQHIINEFKSAMLPLFGFKERPKIAGEKIHVPEALKMLYEVQQEFPWDTASLPLPGLHTGSANTVRTFTHVESPIDDKFQNHNKFRLKFDINSIPGNEKLTAAEVKVNRQMLVDGGRYQRILVNDIIKRGIKGVRGPIMRLIDSKVIDTRKNDTISLDVFPAVERWINNPAGNHGILVSVYSTGKRKQPPKKHLRLKRDVEVSEWAEKQPLLFTYTDDGKNKQRTGTEFTKMREKRSSRSKGQKRIKHEKDPCRRRQMYVNFQDVGWNDWIVAPLGYDAFYCSGDCDYPMPDHLNTTNHAIVQSLMNSVTPHTVPKPCCVPTHLSSISMLYVDNTSGDNKVILKNYKEMVVEACGCR